MAIPPEVVQINPDDVAKDEKKVVEYLAGILNNFLLESTNSLNKQLTFGDNFRGEVRSLDITGGQDTTFKFRGTGIPRGIILTSFYDKETPDNVLADPVGALQWSTDGKSNITIKPVKGFVTDTVYTTTLVILGE